MLLVPSSSLQGTFFNRLVSSRKSAYSIVHRTPPQKTQGSTLNASTLGDRLLHVIVLDRYTGS